MNRISSLLASLSLFVGACAHTSNHSNTENVTMTKATMIRLTANTGKSDDLANFLRSGSALVAETEPATVEWHALGAEQDAQEQAIFDTFIDQAGREAHFGGQVAAALKANASELVQDGWDQGVVANVVHYDVLAAHVSDEPEVTLRKATFIPIVARAGKANALEAFLIAGRDLVAETEPGTKQWYALKQEGVEGHFVIYDLFADDAGRAAHFAGKVAAALQSKAEELVEGGWENGVVANVVHFDVNATKPSRASN